MAKMIDRDTYLKALGLFALAAGHQKMVEQAETALASLLGSEDRYAGQISDAIYSGKHSTEDFNLALNNFGVEVEAANGK